MNIESTPQDLFTPSATSATPAPGRRVRQSNREYAGTSVHHALYLPSDWRKDKTHPVIIEYAGNKWKTSPGTVEGSNLGYGISGGTGVIWVCMPFVGHPETSKLRNMVGRRRGDRRLLCEGRGESLRGVRRRSIECLPGWVLPRFDSLQPHRAPRRQDRIHMAGIHLPQPLRRRQ